MLIDIHAHAYKTIGPKQDGRIHFATPDQLRSRYGELGIEEACLLPNTWEKDNHFFPKNAEREGAKAERKKPRDWVGASGQLEVIALRGNHANGQIAAR